MPELLTLAVTWPPGLEVLYGSSAGGCCPLLPVTHRTRKEPGGGAFYFGQVQDRTVNIN